MRKRNGRKGIKERADRGRETGTRGGELEERGSGEIWI